MNGGMARPVRMALTVGIIALLLSLPRLAGSPAGFFRGYLPACLFWISLPVGSLAWLMIHRLTGGGWGILARPVLAAGAGVLPVNVLLFLPLAFGLGHLYAWAGPERAAVEFAGGKAIWLQPGFFLMREAAVLALWTGLAWMLGLWNAIAATAQPSFTVGEDAKSALGLIVYAITITVFAIDWIMSLEPRWSSTNIGFLGAVGPLLAALAFATAVLCFLMPDRSSTMHAARFGDLGGLLLALVLLFGYLVFQQYLTLWSENLPDKSLWYVQRNHAGWRGWSWLMTAVYGALPFGLLLSRDLKRDPRRLIRAAVLILAGSLLYAYWEVLPSFYATPGDLSVLDVLPLIGIGGLWLAAYLWLLPRCLAHYGTEEPRLGQ